jgi:hypothetical protein
MKTKAEKITNLKKNKMDENDVKEIQIIIDEYNERKESKNRTINELFESPSIKWWEFWKLFFND